MWITHVAIYRLEAKVIGRKSKASPDRQTSVVAKAAYRSGEKLKDERNDMTFNYVNRSQQVTHSEIIAPEEAHGWLFPQKANEQLRNIRERLWNMIERVEKRKDSQLAREFVASLPKELDHEQGTELVREWCSHEFVSKGYIVDFNLHKSKNGKNPHAHILCAMRPVEGSGFGKKPDMQGKFFGRGQTGRGAKSQLMEWRESWEKFVNTALERAGRDERVDHRSLKDRGIDQIPEPKIGVAAMAMERRGIVEDSDRARLARETKMINEMMPYFRSLQKHGYIREAGVGHEWWQRSMTFMSRMRDYAANLIERGWQKVVGRGRDHEQGPER
jgi:hypothetical protein